MIRRYVKFRARQDTCTICKYLRAKTSYDYLQKIKELTYMHSEGILSGELKHGPLAMIDKDMPCIMLITKDNTYKVHNIEVV